MGQRAHPEAESADDDRFPASASGRFLWNWTPAMAAAVAIFAASSLPDLGALPGGMSDHTWHFVAYAVFGGLCLRATARATWEGVTVSTSWKAWLMAVAYGASDEWHQSFVPGRVAAIDDLVADALGALFVILIALVAAAGRRLEDRKV